MSAQEHSLQLPPAMDPTAAPSLPLPRKRSADEAELRGGGAPPPGPTVVVAQPMSGAAAAQHASSASSQHAATASAIEIQHGPKPPPLSTASGAPSDTAAAAAGPSSSRAKKSDRGYKGLRQFSMLVCKKVEEKGTTTYNEVADELVLQVMQEKTKVFDEKNIRRRVYDALNVLMAMDIITKEKKAISWKGLPTSASQDLDMLGRERDFRLAEIAKKRQTLQEMLVQQVCYRNLTARNAARGTDVPNTQKIPLPFLVVNTHASAVIQCNMSPDLTDVTFDFSMPFEINDDNTILNRLGLHKTDWNTLREMMPEEMLQYCQRHGLLDAVLSSSDPSPADADEPGPPSSGAAPPRAREVAGSSASAASAAPPAPPATTAGAL